MIIPRTSAILAARIALLLSSGVWIALLLGFAGRYWWIADLFSHFRAQYAVLFWMCAIALLSLRRFWPAMTSLAGAVLTTATVIAYVSGPRSATLPIKPDFRLVTFNKYRHNPDTIAIAAYLENIGADVVALQEVESTATVQLLSRHLPSYPYLYATSDALVSDVVFSRWPIRTGETIELGAAQVAKVTIDWHGRAITIMGVHLHWPTSSANVQLRNAELRRIAQLSREIESPLLVGGDFNISVWSPNFSLALEGTALRDCARGKPLVNTWPTWLGPFAIRIDQCLCSPHWQVVDISRGPALGSDHYPTLTEVALIR